MQLWLSNRARLQRWWNDSASDARHHLLLDLSARRELDRKAHRAKKDEGAFVAKRRAFKSGSNIPPVRHPDSFGRASSDRLRRNPTPCLDGVGTGAAESVLELAELNAGNRSKARRMEHMMVPYY
jgi:hypothetical protein